MNGSYSVIPPMALLFSHARELEQWAMQAWNLLSGPHTDLEHIAARANIRRIDNELYERSISWAEEKVNPYVYST